jgi:hypothetical protein
MAQPKLVNMGVAAMLRTPLLHRIGSSYVMLLRFPGRKTGRRYTVPVGYGREGETVLTTTDDRWWRNMSTSAPVTLLIRRRWHAGTAVAVTDEEEAVAGMAALIRAFPRYGGWLEVGTGPDGKPSEEDLRREVRRGRVLIRVADLARLGSA